MLNSLAGYIGRGLLGLGLALVLATVGVILARMGLLLFGLTSWSAWLTILVVGAGLGAGLGSAAAWLWLKGLGVKFTLALAGLALAAGVAGAWYAYHYGAGVEPECCASPTMGPIAYTILGATLGASLAATLAGITGRSILLAWRRGHPGVGSPIPLARQD